MKKCYLLMLIAIATASLSGITTVGTAMAQTWPAKPIELIVPFPPGAVDSKVRVIVERASKVLGRPIVMQNKPGAGQRIGTTAYLRAPADGYTLGVVTNANGAITPALDPHAGYDPRQDFTLISLTYEASLVMIAHPSLGANSINDLIRIAKANPGKLNYGSSGVGASYHLWFEVFKSLAQIDITHIPYKGLSPAMQELVGGQTQVMFTDLVGAQPLIDTGRIIGLAFTAEQRSTILPKVPTMKEAGTPFLAANWLGFAGPAGIPRDISARLTNIFNEVTRSPEVRAQLESSGGQTVLGLGPTEFAARVANDYDKVRELGERYGIKID